MIECKAVCWSPKVEEQVIGYNHHVNSSFVSVANKDKIKTFWYDGASKGMQSVDFLPPYSQLMKAVGK